MNVILSLMLAILTASPFTPLRAFAAQTKQDSSVSSKDLRNAPTMIVVGNRTLRLSAELWRDFMPGPARPDGSPLNVGVRITSDDKQPLPTGLRIHRIWVLNGEEIWDISNLRGQKSGLVQEKDQWVGCGVTSLCQFSVSGGPRWEPGIYVDVVVRLSDSEGKEHLLRAPNQRVIATA